MYENKRVRIRLLILRLTVRCALWSKKYGTVKYHYTGRAVSREPRNYVECNVILKIGLGEEAP